jgi:hypothetical protein
MGEGPGGWDFDALERDIGVLRGVTHARLVAEKGRIVECHVISDASKDPRQLKRDIETLAIAKHDCELNHKAISITELPGVEIRVRDLPLGGGDVPLELVSVSTTIRGGLVTCKVVVRHGDATGEGFEHGGATPRRLRRVVAKAALDACSSALADKLPADVDNALIATEDPDVATITLAFVDADGDETIVGGARPVRGDENEAFAAAVVDTVRRHLGV